MNEAELKKRFEVWSWLWKMNRKYIDLETKKMPDDDRQKLWHDLLDESESFMQKNGIKPHTHNSELVKEFLFTMEKWEKEINDNDNR